MWWNRVLCGNLVFLSKIENQFVLKISASIKLCLLDLFKRKIYQIQLGGLLKAPFAENITFFCLEIELLVQNWEIYFCAWNQLFVSKVMVYVKSCFFGLIIANRVLHKISTSIKLRLLNLLKRNIYQTQPDGLFKAPFAKNIIFFVWKPSF